MCDRMSPKSSNLHVLKGRRARGCRHVAPQCQILAPREAIEFDGLVSFQLCVSFFFVEVLGFGEVPGVHLGARLGSKLSETES